MNGWHLPIHTESGRYKEIQPWERKEARAGSVVGTLVAPSLKLNVHFPSKGRYHGRDPTYVASKVRFQEAYLSCSGHRQNFAPQFSRRRGHEGKCAPSPKVDLVGGCPLCWKSLDLRYLPTQSSYVNESW